jgi:hypothetical protein
VIIAKIIYCLQNNDYPDNRIPFFAKNDYCLEPIFREK